MSPILHKIESTRFFLAMNKRWLVSAAVCVGLLCSFLFGTQLGRAQGAAAAPGKATPPPIVSLAAQAIGIKRCFAAIDATARRATQNATRQDILIDWYRTAPDLGPSFSMTALEFGNEPVVFSLAAIPTPDNRCTIFAEQISASRQPCPAFAAEKLPGYVANSLLPSINVYTNAGRPTETISLVNTATGCVVIRRQATFDWGKG